MSLKSNGAMPTNMSPDTIEEAAAEVIREYQDLPIGKELRRLRGRMSLRELARQTGIPNTYLSNLETGARRPGFKILHQLASFHGVPHERLLALAGLGYEGMIGAGDPTEGEVERCYRFLLEDPRLAVFDPPETPPPIELQRFIIRMYEELSGKRLL